MLDFFAMLPGVLVQVMKDPRNLDLIFYFILMLWGYQAFFYVALRLWIWNYHRRSGEYPLENWERNK